MRTERAASVGEVQQASSGMKEGFHIWWAEGKHSSVLSQYWLLTTIALRKLYIAVDHFLPVNVQYCVEAVPVAVEEERGRVAGRVPVAVQQHLLQGLRAEGPP